MTPTTTNAATLDTKAVESFVSQTWDASIVPSITEYIAIPNKSPAFDKDWKKNGHMDRAVELIAGWCRARAIPGLKLEVVRLKNEKGEERTPVIFMEIPGQTSDTVLLYGHLDKQPEMTGWSEGLSPWTPVLRGDKLYGRGGADDGYAAYASLVAIEALERQKIPHARCVVLIEGCEESGSYDLPAYVDHLAPRIGTPSLIVCLDSGCGNYEQLWGTTSLRGLVGGDLSVEVLTEGVHSGDASGIVPSSFRIVRQLLDRIDDNLNGLVSAPEFNVDIPEQRQTQAALAAQVLQDQVYNKFPFIEGAEPVSTDAAELILNRTWRPALSITGAEGLPALANAGNVLRPKTSVKISLRIPPGCDASRASARLKQLLESDPPYGANVVFTPDWAATGWHAPPMADWLDTAINQASIRYFGKPAMHMGEGGTIPFMGMLGEKFPEAQFLITGVLGPHSNAHGPNEFLHIPTAKKLTCCVAEVIARHFIQK